MTFTYYSAPLELNSDNAFRTLCHNNGADVTFTEMIRVQSYLKKNKSTMDRLAIYDDTPTIVQLLAGNENQIRTFLEDFKPFPGFMGFNLNMGCPSPHIIRTGLGAAFMKRVEKTQKLIDIFREFGFPISLKIRLGLNRFEREKKTYLNLLKNTTPDFFVIHARDAKQTYAHKADFSIYEECVATGKVIVANGDITTASQIEELKKIGVKGAMIGRAAVYHPAIFNWLQNKKIPSLDELKTQYLELAILYKTKELYVENISTRIGKKIMLGGSVQG
ncbi:MAG: tRNA-dihydrouridine synthase B [Candidatus Woesearchaeota archaeon]|jgi:tRNA-dihydrouridine synthase B